MAEPATTDPTESLLTWALAAFHVALLVAAVVSALYAIGVLGGVLAGLDTEVGSVAYLYLWGVTWWTNRELLDGLDGTLVADRPPFGELVGHALKWGGLAGALVFLPLLLVGGGFIVVAGGAEALPFVVLGGALGLLLAAGVGVVVGVGLLLLDWLLLAVANEWLPVGHAAGGDPGPVSPD